MSTARPSSCSISAEIFTNADVPHLTSAQEIDQATRVFDVWDAEGIAVICHELRNSVAVVQGVARLLRSHTGGAGIETAGSLIDRHMRQINRHIDELLEPPRRDGSRHDLQCARTDVSAIARYAAEGMAADMARRGHRFVAKLPEKPIWLHADGARLEQAFTNLLVNAAKYTPDGGEIDFIVVGHGEEVCVYVCDSGIGIEPAKLSQVFDMFVQLETMLPGGKGGRGIGLAVVRHVVELHGGTVRADSLGLGKGSEFVIVLPILDPARS
jgi:signal transduction histidine kinase